MVEGKDWKLGRSAAEVAASAGKVRPDVGENDARRQTGADLRGGLAARGEVPLPGKNPAIHPHRPTASATPARATPAQSSTPDRFPVAGLPDAAGHKTGDTATAARPQPRVSPNSPEMEQAVQAGKQAAADLARLAQGGVNTVTGAIRTAQDILSSAFAALPKALAQAPQRQTLGKQPASHPTPVRTQAPGGTATEMAVVAKAQAEEQTGARRGKDAETVATQVAQRAPSPFATQPQGDKGVAGRNDKFEEIATDGATAEVLGKVVTGRGITAIPRAQEFTSGGDGGFGDPKGESAGLAGKVGAAPQIHVYGDTRDYPETGLLYAKLGLSGVLYGAQELLQRAVPIGERIANTRDDTPLSQRMLDDKAGMDQAVLGTRGSVYGPGRMFG